MNKTVYSLARFRTLGGCLREGWWVPIIFRLPVAVVAGAALAGTFATSVIGVIVYSVLPLPGGGHATPDWWLGTLFGLGGLAGMYLGAATQKHIPQRVLKLGLGLLLSGLGGLYLWPAFALVQTATLQ